MQKRISLIIACYNEEGHLLNSYQKIQKFLRKQAILYQLLFIDDKSTDNTRQIITQITKKDKNTSYIFHTKNIGRGGTVAEGIAQAKYENAGFLDIDLEVSEKYIPTFLKKLEEGNDVVVARRSYVRSPKAFIRILMSEGYMILAKIALGLPYQDTEAGYKFFKKSRIMPILAQVTDKKWFWDTEVVAKSYYRDLKIAEVPVFFIRRKDKKSTVKVFQDSIYYFKSLYYFRSQLRTSFLLVHLLSLYASDIRGILYVLLKWLLFPFNTMEKMLPKSGVFLDLGCGEGVMANILVLTSQFRKVVGVDLSKGRIQIAHTTQQKRKNISFVQKDVFKYKFPYVHGIVMSDFLHHLQREDQDVLIQKCFDSLEKQGVLVIKDVDKADSLRSKLSRFWDFVLYPHDKIAYRSKSEWERLLKKTGFQVSSYESSFLSPFSTVIYKATKQ